MYSKSNIIVIEDCAQSFGSRMKNSSTFPRSEILCYSLSKNLYSFGGGILATNNSNLYRKISNHYNKLPQVPFYKTFYKLIKNLLLFYSDKFIFDNIYNKILNLRKFRSANPLNHYHDLNRPNKYTLRSIHSQLLKFRFMKKRRIVNAYRILKKFTSRRFSRISKNQ